MNINYTFHMSEMANLKATYNGKLYIISDTSFHIVQILKTGHEHTVMRNSDVKSIEHLKTTNGLAKNWIKISYKDEYSYENYIFISQKKLFPYLGNVFGGNKKLFHELKDICNSPNYFPSKMRDEDFYEEDDWY